MRIGLLIAGFVLAILAGVFMVTIRSTPSSTATPTPNEQPTPKPQPSATNITPSAVGQYLTYTPTIVAELAGTHKVLFFHAPWCPQCRALEASIQANSIPAGVAIIKVDYDSNQALRKQYGVTLQTTLVRIDDAGAKLESFVAYDEPTFSAIEHLLR